MWGPDTSGLTALPPHPGFLRELIQNSNLSSLSRSGMPVIHPGVTNL